MKKQKMILTRRAPGVKNGQFINKTESFEVEVLSIVEPYAMVRRVGCAPFVARTKELKALG